MAHPTVNPGPPALRLIASELVFALKERVEASERVEVRQLDALADDP